MAEYPGGSGGGVGPVGPVGPQGPAGVDGSDGAPGAAGAKGTSFYTVTANTNNLGLIPGAVVGDYVINAHTASITVLDRGGVAPGGVVRSTGLGTGVLAGSVRGAAGATGATGATGPTGPKGDTGVPGADGDGLGPLAWYPLILNAPGVTNFGAPFVEIAAAAMCGSLLVFRGLLVVDGGAGPGFKIADLPPEIPATPVVRRMWVQDAPGSDAGVNLNPDGTMTVAQAVDEYVVLDDKTIAWEIA